MNKVYMNRCHVCNEVKACRGPANKTCDECLSNGYKWCATCNTVQPTSNFSKSGSHLRGSCRPCTSKQSYAVKKENGYYDKQEVKERQKANHNNWRRNKYANDEEYRSREIQRCRVRKATKDSRGYHTDAEWHRVLGLFDFSCAYCGSSEHITKDHVVPLPSEGANTIDNLIPACHSCNSSKNNKDLVEWYTAQAFYDKNRLQAIIKYMRASEEGGGAKCHI